MGPMLQFADGVGCSLNVSRTAAAWSGFAVVVDQIAVDDKACHVSSFGLVSLIARQSHMALAKEMLFQPNRRRPR